MPRDATGVFSRPVSPYVAGTPITADAVNAEMDGIATGLTGSLARDGSSNMLAPLKMGGQRIVGLGAATASNDAAQLDQVNRAIALKTAIQNYDWTGNFEMTTTETLFATLVVPARTKMLEVWTTARLSYFGSGKIDFAMRARIRNGDDTADAWVSDIGDGALQGGQAAYVTLPGFQDFGFETGGRANPYDVGAAGDDSGPVARFIKFYALIGSSVSGCFITHYRMKARSTLHY